MAAESFTPGPWVLTEPSIVGLADVLFGPSRQHNDGCATIIASVGKYDEARANARLIAAAPELLAACKSIAAMAVSWQPLSNGDISDVLKAIAKAEGR